MAPKELKATIAEMEDEAAVDALRKKFGDAEAAKLAADLYKLRRTPAPAASAPSWSGLPRGLIVLVAIWVGLLETADKLPRLLLTVPLYEATLADYHAKMMQPDLMAAQVEKAQMEAKAASFQPAMAAAQAFKAEIDASASGQTMQAESSTRLGVMFDLLDPEHPNLVSRGAIEPDVTPLVPLLKAKQ